jgi:hypothetical protein
VEGAQPGESASDAEQRANEESREAVVELKQTVTRLRNDLGVVRAAEERLARSFDLAIAGLGDRLEALALIVGELAKKKE